jgi:hypothetical protein
MTLDPGNAFLRSPPKGHGVDLVMGRGYARPTQIPEIRDEEPVP